jgi:acyl-CoA synthetase (AMP-forming)/AMP-acid ligase II
MARTVIDRIAHQADSAPASIAICAPGRRPLTYAALRDHVLRIVARLNSRGIRRNDRVAIVLPGGPEMSTACLAVMSGATAAPLNPDFKEVEYETVFRALLPRALLTDGRRGSAAESVARALGIDVIEIDVPPDADAGHFDIASGGLAPGRGSSGLSEEDDVALLLQTSGTTAKPKTVPLTQRNLSASVTNICNSLRLTSEDRCLHLLPNFHIGGIVDVFASPLAAGGSVVCAPGFSAAAFFRCLAEFSPTWSQGVPAMLQELVSCAPEQSDLARNHSLRLMRSVSAPLPPALMDAFERAFGTPVIEIYGMSETAGLICSNPLPPAARKRGSVGVAAGPQVRVTDKDGNVVQPLETGEVEVNGDNVMRGYDDAPAENEQVFRGPWLRTGDTGHVDADGYLFLTGRLKEQINRGGEKISPGEIDRAVLAHPDVADAATFSIPHVSLGEDVAVAVVPKAGATLAEKDVVRFLGERLAYFKVPRVVHFVERIPRTRGGKLRRNELREMFGAVTAAPAPAAVPYAPPQSPVGKVLARLWSDILGIDRVGVDDDFFDLGGDSLKAAHVVNELQQRWGGAVFVSALFDARTIARFERHLDEYYPEVTARMLGQALRPPDRGVGRRVDAAMLEQFGKSIARTARGAEPSAPRNAPAAFILSPPRSGSTLLRAMLAGNPGLFAPPELYLLPFDDLADRKAWFSGAQKFQLEGNVRAVMQLMGCDADVAQRFVDDAEGKGTSTQDYYRVLQQSLGARLLVDKTPYYAARQETLGRAERCFAEPLYIHLLRHPYGMIRSFEEMRLEQLWYPRLVGAEAAGRSPSPWTSRELAELIWVTLHRNIVGFLDGIPRERQCMIRFEDLVREPRPAMERLCTFLRVPFSEDMLEPQRDSSTRMTDGLHAVSKMIGDTKFHLHQGISTGAADLWKAHYEVDFLGEPTFALAAQLGYHETVASSASRMEFDLEADS